MNAQRLLEKQEEFGRHVIEQTAMMQTILNAARFLTPSNREYVARLIREIRDADQPKGDHKDWCPVNGTVEQNTLGDCSCGASVNES